MAGSIWNSGAGRGALSAPWGLVSSGGSVWGRAGGTPQWLSCSPMGRLLLTFPAQELWILYSHPRTQGPPSSDAQGLSPSRNR